jgi:hypothetical protein
MELRDRPSTQLRDYPSIRLKEPGTNVHPSPEVKLKGRAVSIVSNFLKDSWMVINYQRK